MNDQSAEDDDENSKTILHVVNIKGRAELKRTAGGELIYVRADGTHIVKKDGKEEEAPLPPPVRNLRLSNSTGNILDWTCLHCAALNWGSKKRSDCYKCKVTKEQVLPAVAAEEAKSKSTTDISAYQRELQESLDKANIDSPVSPMSPFGRKPGGKTKKKPLGLKISPIGPPAIVIAAKPEPAPVPSPPPSPTSKNFIGKSLKFVGATRQLTLINDVTSGSQSSIKNAKAQVDNQIRSAVSKPFAGNKKTMKTLKPIKQASDLDLRDLVIDETNTLGSGAYGTVYKCWIRADEAKAKKENRHFPKPSDIKAIKVMKLDTSGCREDYDKISKAALNELKTWIAVTGGMLSKKNKKRSTHVVTPLRPFETEQEFQILMEFMHFGSLDDLMLTIARIPADELRYMVQMISQGGPNPMDRIQVPEKDGPTTPPAHHDVLTPLPEPILSYVMEMVLRGLEFLHNLEDADGKTVNMVHQDIKPGNILIDNWAMVKIGDFGLAGFRDVGYAGGTRLYMPPEMAVASKKCTQAADLWSLGVSALECALGLHSGSNTHLFSASATSSYLISRDFDPDEQKLREHVSWASVIQTIEANENLSAVWVTLSAPFKDFCKNCLEFNPDERPPAKVMKDHQFIRRRSRWKKPEMKSFLDSLIQRLITQGRLAGSNVEAMKWQQRGWQEAKNATDCSTHSTQSSAPIFFSEAVQQKRRMWMGNWRGRGRGQQNQFKNGRGSSRASRGPPTYSGASPSSPTEPMQPIPQESDANSKTA
eukprot:TRINITY_DN709_c1_g5_i1.p1 TRINITY_DN709_c1_g5~~TRINITY_DN709_c1_g5_i1.p1  ORF type:complete len:762 (+),score=112.55 TRINITY_DN709_c1_g5_i1:373-2658(+)